MIALVLLAMRYALGGTVYVRIFHAYSFLSSALTTLALGCSVERFDAPGESACTDCSADASSPAPSEVSDPAPPAVETDSPTETTDAAETDGEVAETDIAETDVIETDTPVGQETDTEVNGTETSDDEEPVPEDPSVDCVAPTSGRVQAYFEVPGAAGAALGDYFRLPFPNDFYLTDQQPLLGDYPTATAAAKAFVGAVQASADGFSASPTIIFRFSGKVDFETLLQRFHVLDITESSGGSSPPLKLLYSPGGGKYVCHNALYARPAPGHALLPGRTYAAWIDTGVLSEDALDVDAPDQFAAMLAPEPPMDPVLGELYGKYEPLRAYFDAEGIPAADVLNATVFTVGDVLEPMRRLSVDVLALPAPVANDWVLCDGNSVSPCDDGTEERRCGPLLEDRLEYHARVALPVFQQGEPPYFNGGGEISWNGPVRTEGVCMTMTVPTTAPPPGGFPVVLTSHGAGGSFKTALSPSIGGRLTQGAEVDGQRVAFAVLGYDGVQHGPRRGADPALSSLDPDLLLFNILNPTGTLGTSLQGGLDVLSMARFAKTLPAALPAGVNAELNTERLLFWGHSQGGMQGAIALPYSDDVHAAAFSGLGAGFLQTMLLRTEPPLIPNAVQQAVFDPGPDGELVFAGEYHPALALVQHLVDSVDPLHHAKLLVAEPETTPLHTFQIYGTNDAFSPGIAQRSFAIAAELGLATADPSADPNEAFEPPLLALPLAGNLAADGAVWTAGARQYGPVPGENGHFVVFDVESAATDLATFLATAAVSELPSIGQ